MIHRGLGIRERTILSDRREAEGLAEGLPPLLAKARQLAATLSLGIHGRRRSGPGEDFWQYRPAVAGDRLGEIDWRKSARSDEHFLRQKEWQTSQPVTFWIDLSQSMQYLGRVGRRTEIRPGPVARSCPLRPPVACGRADRIAR